mmetsp:Transcript_133943/g.232493  ORF Transcript_133943/g.232493 Transcript_133943/m.232493 type:complete len:106 (-) Transcript_133943:1886-2203(-)
MLCSQFAGLWQVLRRRVRAKYLKPHSPIHIYYDAAQTHKRPRTQVHTHGETGALSRKEGYNDQSVKRWQQLKGWGSWEMIRKPSTRPYLRSHSSRSRSASPAGRW